MTFQDSGADLIVTLTNISLSDVLVPADVLTAVFFDIASNPLVTRTSAVIGGGSTVLLGGTEPGGVVGGEWSYVNGLNQYGANSGISSTGLNIFGPGNRFPGGNLAGPNSPNGLDYGLTSLGDDPDTGSTPVTGKEPLIQNQVVFTLGGWMLGDPTPHISNVTFQYGTSFDEPHVTVPARRAGTGRVAALYAGGRASGPTCCACAKARPDGRNADLSLLRPRIEWRDSA